MADNLLVEDESQAQTGEMDLSGDSTVILIDLIRNYEFLYNLQDKDYKNMKKKAEAWQEIAEILKISVDECQKKWKALRDKYTREKREHHSGAGLPETSWEYFHNMSFYEKYTKPRKTYSTLKRKAETQQEFEPSRPGPSSSVWSSVDTILSPILSPTSSGRYSAKEKKVAKGRAEEGEEDFLSVAKQLAESFKTLQQQGNNQNRTCIEYIFSCLENMPPEEAKKKRAQLLQVIQD